MLLPLALASLVGLPFWLRQKAIAGNLLGSGIIAAVIIVLIWREFGAVVQAQNECAINCAKSFEEIYSPLLGLVVMGWVAPLEETPRIRMVRWKS